MSKNSTIVVEVCPVCKKEYKESKLVYSCTNHPYPSRPKLERINRSKMRVAGDFIIADFFTSRSSAGLVIEHTVTGERYEVYISDLFQHLKGQGLANIVLEETKKGTAHGWKVVK